MGILENRVRGMGRGNQNQTNKDTPPHTPELIMTATKSQTQEHNALTSHFRTSMIKRKALEEAREKKQMTYQGVKNNNQTCGFCRELFPHGSGREWLETVNTKETNPINIEILYFFKPSL